MCVGESIKRLRKQKGWTQKDLAENSTINLSSIKQYEAGRSNPKYDNRIKLANTLGVHPDDLTSEPRPYQNVCMNFGERLKTLRKYRKLTQRELGTKCDMPDSQIRKYESNNTTPRLDTLIKLANALNVQLSDLIGEQRPDPNVCDVRVTGIIGQEQWYDIEFHTPYHDEYLKVSEFCKKLVDERKHRDE